MIRILDGSLRRLGVIKYALSASRMEEINGENTLDYTAVLTNSLDNLVDEDSLYELDNDYFDTAAFKKLYNEDNTFTVEVEGVHVSYRLNNPEYNIDYFAEEGTPTAILTKILAGTGFTVGTVEFTTPITYYAQEAKSRRQILMEFVSYLKGEVKFNKFQVSIYQHLGSTVSKLVLKDRNVKMAAKSIDKKQLDEEGHPIVSYECTPLYLPGDDYALGDNIMFMQKQLGIKEKLRVVKITTNPYDISETAFEFANYTGGIANSIYEVAKAAVAKDKLYNGTRIGPEYGFEAIRNDKKARAYFRSDGMKFQSGDGTGNTWKDRLYYEYNEELDETVLIFDGLLSADTIQAMSAYIGTLITDSLYATKGYIANLTVDELDTSDKVVNYLNLDTSPVNYIRIYNDVIEFYTATTDGQSVVHLYDKDYNMLFWVDGDNKGKGMTTNETDWPVYTYAYTDTVVRTIDLSGTTEWASASITDNQVSFAYADGTSSEYELTKNESGNITAINGKPINWNTSSGGTTPAPLLISNAAVESVISLKFDSPMASPVGKQAQFSVKVNGLFVVVLSLTAGTSSSTINLHLANDTKIGDVITVSYTKGTVASAAGGLLASFTDKSVLNANTKPDYQIWATHKDSPVFTSDYPYQAIISRTDQPHIILLCSKYKLYTSSGKLTNIRSDIKAYYVDEDTNWALYGSSIADMAYLVISECNENIYTNSSLMTVFKAATV